MRVTACVICGNAADQIVGVCDSLARQTHPDLDVVVVDNASVDGSADLVSRRDDITLIRNRTNRGFAGAANQGVQHAAERGSSVFMTVNPDVRLEPEYVERVVAALSEASGRGRSEERRVGKEWRWRWGVPALASRRESRTEV